MGILGAILNLRFVFCGHVNYRMVIIALALPLMISGCASVRGYPDRLIEPDIALDDVKKSFNQKNITKCDEETDEMKKIACRNNILSAGMIGVDVNFSEFERKLFKEGREASFLTTIATLGLTTAGAMTGTAALSGIATGIIGSKEAFDKEILLDQAKSAIHAQMRALRQTVANRIRYGMNTKTFNEYPLDVALIDIEEYYNAGTLLGAFVGITASAGLQVKQSEENQERIAVDKEPKVFTNTDESVTQKTETSTPKEDSILSKTEKDKTDGFNKIDTVTTPTTEAMNRWLEDDGDNAKFNQLNKWLAEKAIMDESGHTVLPYDFANIPKYERERKLAIDFFKIQ